MYRNVDLTSILTNILRICVFWENFLYNIYASGETHNVIKY